jgi:hypothetical protein
VPPVWDGAGTFNPRVWYTSLMDSTTLIALQMDVYSQLIWNQALAAAWSCLAYAWLRVGGWGKRGNI